MNLYVVCLGLWAIFTVYQKEISFFFYFSHRILPFGWFSMKNKSTNTFSETSSLMHLYHTGGVHAIKVWRYFFPSLCPLPAWPAVRLCSSIPAHFTLCVVSEKIGTFYQLGFLIYYLIISAYHEWPCGRSLSVNIKLMKHKTLHLRSCFPVLLIRSQIGVWWADFGP